MGRVEGKILMIFFRYYCTLRNADREARLQLSKYTDKEILPIQRTIQYRRYFSIFAEAISLLLGKQKDSSVREKMIFLSFLAPVFDDLSDVYFRSTDEIESWLLRRTQIQGIPQAEIYWNIYSHLLQNLPQQKLFSEYLRMLNEAQRNPNLNPLIIPPDKQNKGGLAAVLCRLLWENELMNGEKEVFLQLGFIVQLMDDFLDWYDDALNHHPNHWKGIPKLNEIDEIYSRHYSAWIQRVMQLPYPQKNKQDFLWFLHPALSVFWVQMTKWQKNSLFKEGHFPDKPSSLHRRDFICDMENFANKIRLWQVSSNKSILLWRS